MGAKVPKEFRSSRRSPLTRHHVTRACLLKMALRAQHAFEATTMLRGTGVPAALRSLRGG